jgi:hypothetical protein
LVRVEVTVGDGVYVKVTVAVGVAVKLGVFVGVGVTVNVFGEVGVGVGEVPTQVGTGRQEGGTPPEAVTRFPW